jgi:hypothetical protein
MDKPQLLSVGNLVEVAKIGERGTPAHEGGQAYICRLNHQNSGKPPIPENQLRVKGQEYFENREITDSMQWKNGKEKFALLIHWENTLIPRIDQVCTELSQKMNNKRVIPIVQDGNASAHREKNLMDYLAAKLSERGGLMMPHPPNSPQTNSCDDYVFTSMSKECTTIQGIENGGRTLSEGQLWINVKWVFDNFDLDKVAWAFVHHRGVGWVVYCVG